jgi:hypothetical protein
MVIVSPLNVINAELDAGVVAEIELCQVAVRMRLAHVLMDANQAALEDRKEAFKRVGVHVAADPFELGMIDAFMLGNGRVLVVRGLVGRKTAVLMDVLVDDAHGNTVQGHRPHCAAAFDKAHDHEVVASLMSRRAFGLA